MALSVPLWGCGGMTSAEAGGQSTGGMSGGTAGGAAGMGAAGDGGAGGQQVCVWAEDGACTSNDDKAACCLIMVTWHFLVPHGSTCKVWLPPPPPTSPDYAPTCWPMFPAVPKPCANVSEQGACYMRPVKDGTEVLAFQPGNTDTPELLGPEWSVCNEELFYLPDCT